MRTPSIEIFLALSLALLNDVGAAKSKNRKVEEKPKIGLALAGGSITAANICGSTMRGFQQQRIMIDGEERPAMDAFDYTSGLSGGNFPNLMYAFATDTTSDEILDADGINDPTQITAEALREVPEKSMFAQFTKTIIPTVLRAMAGSFVFGWEFWPQVVYYHFLEPLGIPAHQQMGTDVKQREDAKPTPVVEFSMTGPAEGYPDWLHEHASRKIIAELREAGAADPNVEMPEDWIEIIRASVDAAMAIGIEIPPGYDEFYQVSPESVMNALENSKYQVPVPFFSTPDEVSSLFTAGRLEFDPTSNKTAEPVDFVPYVGSASDEDGIFSLERLLGLGTALLPIILSPNLMGSIIPAKIEELIGDPLTLSVPTADGNMRIMSFADGGYNDATGIPALVALKVRKIISVQVITGQALTLSRDPLYWPVANMKRFFGVVDRLSDLNPDSFGISGAFSNHIFDLYSNDENQLVKLQAMLKKLHEAGNPLIATLHNLNVVDNPFWGTEAGEVVDLTLIFPIGVPKRFSDQIPPDAVPPAENKTSMIDNGFFTNLNLNFAPNSLSQRNIVLGEDIEDEEGNVIIPLEYEIELPLEFKLGVEETRMTNFLLSWMVKDAWEGLQDVEGNVIFEGFKSVLEMTEVVNATVSDAPSTTGPEVMSADDERSPEGQDDSSGGVHNFACSYVGLLVGAFVFAGAAFS